MRPRKTSVIASGLALFSMFFGAGNIIFPLLLGEYASANAGYAAIGFLIAGVLFPLLGLLAMLLYNCDAKSFFGRLGKTPGTLLWTGLVLLLGPLGSTPRLLTVAYATLKPYLLGINLPIFSVIAAIGIAPFVLSRNQMMRILGYVLTPILLLSLGVIVVRGIMTPAAPLVASHTIGASITEGLQQGYLLLDLPAALLYAGLVLVYFKDPTQEGEQGSRMTLRRALKASAVALLLLSAVYAGLIYVGAYHATAVNADGAPEEVLRRVAMSFLGGIGGPVASLAVGLACLTTAISQTVVCTSFLKERVFRGKGGIWLPLILTLTVAVSLSSLGFSAIASFLGPILGVLSPALIVLCVVNIFHRLYRFRPIKIPVATALLATVAAYLI